MEEAATTSCLLSATLLLTTKANSKKPQKFKANDKVLYTSEIVQFQARDSRLQPRGIKRVKNINQKLNDNILRSTQFQPL